MIDTRVTGPTHAAVPPESLLGRLTRLIREHRALVILIVAASVVRLLIMVAYRPALWYHGDSGSYILLAQNTLRPQATFAVGYSAFLKILQPTGTLISVVAVQHLLGLLIAVAIYALLRHRGVRRWLACLAAVPILFDALQLVLEHAILAHHAHHVRSWLATGLDRGLDGVQVGWQHHRHLGALDAADAGRQAVDVVRGEIDFVHHALGHEVREAKAGGVAV